MDPRFSQLPMALRRQTVFQGLCDGRTPFGEAIPTLLAHPDDNWSAPGSRPSPRPVVLWMHGRTVSKELDPGRYLRWLRAGIATCAIDLPGHGERAKPGWDQPDHTLTCAEQASVEIDFVLEALAEPRWNHAFDLDRLAIGGMSAGGMVTLIRLCRAHDFACASVESTAGDYSAMKGRSFYVEELVEKLEPARHLAEWRPIPLLALHSEADVWVPVEGVRDFLERLRTHYRDHGADPELVRLKTWAKTGAPYEHAGFGTVSNEAKNLQLDFFRAHFGLSA